MSLSFNAWASRLPVDPKRIQAILQTKDGAKLLAPAISSVASGIINQMTNNNKILIENALEKIERGEALDQEKIIRPLSRLMAQSRTINTTAYARCMSEQTLLTPPARREAFSDRRAYVCGALASLAYFRYEGGSSAFNAIKEFRDKIRDVAVIEAMETKLQSLLPPSNSDLAWEEFRRLLETKGFTLVDTFSSPLGTQAFLTTRKERGETVAFLAFRGTEATSMKDIKSDIKLGLKQVELNGQIVNVHSGFWEALESVDENIQYALDSLSYDRLFVTGHSLGGALAILFTAKRNPDGHGACYTYGAPPVGGMKVADNIKTPIYSVVNSLDVVPRSIGAIPGLIVLGAINSLRIFSKSFAICGMLTAGSWDEKLESYARDAIRHRHPGQLSYLTGSGNNTRLKHNLSLHDRFLMWWNMFTRLNMTKMLKDHSMEQYIEKLKINGIRRNK